MTMSTTTVALSDSDHKKLTSITFTEDSLALPKLNIGALCVAGVLAVIALPIIIIMFIYIWKGNYMLQSLIEHGYPAVILLCCIALCLVLGLYVYCQYLIRMAKVFRDREKNQFGSANDLVREMYKYWQPNCKVEFGRDNVIIMVSCGETANPKQSAKDSNGPSNPTPPQQQPSSNDNSDLSSCCQ